MSNLFEHCNSKVDLMDVLIKQVRPAVMKQLQCLRDEGRIKSSLEANIFIQMSAFDIVTLTLAEIEKPQLCELFGVSDVILQFGDL